MEKKQTAVEWLAEQLLGAGIKDCPNGIIEQAKKMEIEQIVKAYRTHPTASWTNKYGIRYFNKHYGFNYDDDILDINRDNG